MDQQSGVPAADVEQPLARLEAELLANTVELVLLKLLEAVVGAPGVAAGVRHGGVKKQLEQIVAEIVVASHVGARRTQGIGQSDGPNPESEPQVAPDLPVESVA